MIKLVMSEENLGGCSPVSQQSQADYTVRITMLGLLILALIGFSHFTLTTGTLNVIRA
jgi:hypothetical protein